MIAPEPSLEPAPWLDSRSMAGGAWATVVGGAMVGFAGGLLVAGAHLQQRAVQPFGGHGAWVFTSVLATAVVAAAGARGWSRGRPSAAVAQGLVGGLAVAVAGLLASFGAPLAYGAWWPFAVAFGVALALVLPARAAAGPRVGFGAGVVAGVTVSALAGDGTVLAAASLALAFVLAGWRAAAGSWKQPASSWRRRACLAVALVGCGWVGLDGAASGVAAAVGWGAALLGAAAVLQNRVREALVLAALANLLPFLWPRPVPDAAHVRLVARRGTAEVHYRRTDQELQLVVDGQVIDWVGPDRHEAALLATLAHALARPGDRAIVFGLGTGIAVRDLQDTGRLVLDVVDDVAAAAAVRGQFDAVGPLGCSTPALPLPRRRAALAEVVGSLPAGSRQLALLPVPVRACVAALQPDVQRGLRELVGDGLVLQVLALDRTAAGTVHRCFAAAAAAHAHHAVFVVGDAAVLVGSARPIDWERVAPFANWSTSARWLAHRAHIGSVADLQRALLGTFAAGTAPPPPADEQARGRAAVVAVLHAWLQPGPEPDHAADSLLLRWSALQAELRAANARIRACAADADGREQAMQQAARFLHLGAPTPELQAARGLATAEGITLAAPATAARAAFALSPTFFTDVPAVCRELPRPRMPAGDLEDLATLPAPARLVELCREDTPLAVALRARFPSACARALVVALADAPLDDDASRALRELADPFVLYEAGLVLAPAGRERELLALWRGDLPLPNALTRLATRAVDDRVVLAKALRGRREPSIASVLATLLEDDAVEVRHGAAEALQHAFGERVPYDPDWPHSRRHEAAERLRSLHNRTP